jgi:superfamily II DNA or RNA helicase
MTQPSLKLFDQRNWGLIIYDEVHLLLEAHFYTLVSRDTDEQEFAHHRQLFLSEQGYAYHIADESEWSRCKHDAVHLYKRRPQAWCCTRT